MAKIAFRRPAPAEVGGAATKTYRGLSVARESLAGNAAPAMPEVAAETAFYFNIRIPAVALIAKGVRFPPGDWAAIADASVLTWRIEEALAELFPGLKGRVVGFESLTSEFDVQEFERLFPSSGQREAPPHLRR